MRHIHVAVFASIILFAFTAWGQVPIPLPKGGAEVSSDNIKIIDMPSPVFGAAMDPSTGVVGVVGGKSNVVTFYPTLASAASVANPVEVKVGLLTAAIAFKRVGNNAWFLVVCAGDKTLYLIDSAKLQVSAKIKIDADHKVPTSLTAVQDPASPYVYVLAEWETETGNTGPSDLRRINLTTQTDDGPVTPAIANSNEIAVSGDGNWIYGRSLTINPSGFQLYHVEASAKKPTVTPVSSMQRDSGRFIPDPIGVNVISGNELYPANLQDAMVLGPRSTGWIASRSIAACFLTDRPVFFYRESDTLSAFSTNTQHRLSMMNVAGLRAGEKIPATPQRGGRVVHSYLNSANSIMFGMAPRPYYAFLMASNKDNSLVCIDYQRAAVVPIGEFKLPDEPVLHVDVQGPMVVESDHLLTLKLAKASPRVLVSLDQAPNGVKLTDDTLTWTPTTDDIGEKTIALKLTMTDEKVAQTQEIHVTVRRPSLDVGFRPQQIAFSPDGKFAALLNSNALFRNSPRFTGNHIPPVTQLAILDVANQKIVANRTFSLDGRHVAMDAANVYMGVNDSDVVYVLSQKDLSDVKHIFTQGHISAMTRVGNKTLYITTTVQNAGNGISGTTAYSLPDLTEIQSDGTELYGADAMPLAADGNWYFNGLLYDENFEKVRLVMDPRGFIFANPTGSEWQVRRTNALGRTVVPVAPWGVELKVNTLRRQSGPAVGEIVEPDAVILPDVPLCAAIMSTIDPLKEDGAMRYARFQLELYDLSTAKMVANIPLLQEPFDEKQEQGMGPVSRIIARPGELLVPVRNHIFCFNTHDLLLAGVPMPLHFPLQQSAFVVDPAQPLKLDMKAAGGKAPLQYTVTPESPAVSIDQTGTLTVDAAKGMDTYMEAISQHFSHLRIRRPAALPASPEAMYDNAIEQYRQDTADTFKAITGEDSKGVPILLPLTITATDSEQLSASLSFCLVVDVPTEQIKAYLKKGQDESDQKNAQMVQAQAHRELAARTQPVALPPMTGDPLRIKITELEKRNTELEAQVQVLKDLLTQQLQRSSSSRPATQP